MNVTFASGFNPCCIGLAIAGALGKHAVQATTAFQSLLYWISHCGPVDRRTGLAMICFNPCCIGLAIAGHVLGSAYLICISVSILVVLD